MAFKSKRPVLAGTGTSQWQNEHRQYNDEPTGEQAPIRRSETITAGRETIGAVYQFGKRFEAFLGDSYLASYENLPAARKAVFTAWQEATP